MLYRVAIAETSQGRLSIRNWRNAHINAVAPFTRHLLALYCSTINPIELLSTFHNTENLAIWFNHDLSPEYLKKMNDLPLRMLSVALGHISLDEAIQYCPAFRNVTHLEIISLKGSTWNDYRALAEFPKLTHLCFDVLFEVGDEIVLGLLKHCPSLRSLIYLLQNGCTIGIDDSRLLVLQDYIDDLMEDWERSANGGIGLWELADIIIEARKGRLHSISSRVIFMHLFLGHR